MAGEVDEGVKDDVDVDREVDKDVEEEIHNDTVIMTTTMKQTHGRK